LPCRLARAHQVPAALELVAEQLEAQVPLGQLRLRVATGGPHPLVEPGHVPAAVLALRDLALEAGVVQRMVLHLHRHALDRRVEAGPLGHRPGLEGIAHLQAEVVVPPAGVMELHDEDRARQLPTRLARLRFARLVEPPLAAVLGQAHGVAVVPVGCGPMVVPRDEAGANSVPFPLSRSRERAGVRAFNPQIPRPLPCPKSDSVHPTRPFPAPPHAQSTTYKRPEVGTRPAPTLGMDITNPRETRFWRRPRTLWVTAGTTLALLLAMALLRLDAAAPAVAESDVWTDAAVRGEMVREIRATGVLAPRETRWISAAARATVKQRAVEPGARVEQDTVILQLANPELEAGLERAQAAVAGAEAEVAAARTSLQSQL